MSATLIDLKSFDWEGLGTTGLTGVNPPWNTIANTAGLSFVAGRYGGRALQVAEDGISATGAEKSYGTTRPILVVGFAFKVVTAPTTNAQLLRIAHTAGTASLLRVNTSGVLQAGYVDGTGNVGSTVVTDGAWHWVTMRVNVTTNPNTIDWTLDGVAQTSTSKAQAGTFCTTARLGSNTTTHDLTAAYDDFVISETSGDYPLPLHICYGLIPNADGSHALAGHITGDAGETTNLYQKVDEQPGSTTDYIKQTTIGTSDYAEISFPDVASGVPVVDVRIYGAAYAAGTAANNFNVKLLDSSNNELIAQSLDTSETTLRQWSTPVTRPGGGWSVTLINGLKVRLGYSSDVIDVPYFSTLALELATEATVALTATAGLIAVAGGTATLTISLAATAGAVALAGGAATLLDAFAATAGTLALAGGTATLSVVRYLAATAGELVVAGGTATLSVSLPATAGQVSVAGGTAALTDALAATAGQIALAGGTATLSDALPATAGQVELAGGTATLSVVRYLSASAGEVIVAGGAATLTVALASTAGQIELAGGTASLSIGLAATAGTIALAGGTATPSVGLPVTAGEVVIAGGTATLSLASVLQAEAGELAIAGGVATLTVSLAATAGVIELAGGTATLGEITILPASAGQVVLAGGAATLQVALSATAGLVAIAGGTATLGGMVNLPATAGLVTVTGGVAALTIGVPASAGQLAIQGAQAALATLIQAGAGTISISGGTATLGIGGTATAPHVVTARGRGVGTDAKARASTVVAVARGS